MTKIKTCFRSQFLVFILIKNLKSNLLSVFLSFQIFVSAFREKRGKWVKSVKNINKKVKIKRVRKRGGVSLLVKRERIVKK